jgi:hypothetical protein
VSRSVTKALDFVRVPVSDACIGAGAAIGGGGCASLVGVLVDTVVRYQVGEGSSVLVEVDEDTYGVEAVSRTSEGVLEAGQRLESALGSVREAAQAALEAMSKLSPETVEVEFGIKLAGEGGALIAKASAEGHFTVRLSWSPGKES